MRGFRLSRGFTLGSVARPIGDEAGEQARELGGLLGRERGERGLDRAASCVSGALEQLPAGGREHEGAAPGVGRVRLAAHMARLDGRLHESARARLIDADRLGELAHRGRALGALERIEQAEARRVRERMPAGTTPRASSTTSAAPALWAAAAATPATATMVVVLAVLVVGVLRMLPRVMPVPVRVLAAVAVVTLLSEVLGSALQPPPFLIATHRDQRLLDQCDRVVRGGPGGIRP